MAAYIDTPLTIHKDDPDVIREVTLIRYVLISMTTGHQRNAQFKTEHDAKTWQKDYERIVRTSRSIYCIVDKDDNRRSHWCGNYEQCLDYSVAYPPDKRPNFGKDEYTFA